MASNSHNYSSNVQCFQGGNEWRNGFQFIKEIESNLSSSYRVEKFIDNNFQIPKPVVQTISGCDVYQVPIQAIILRNMSRFEFRSQILRKNCYNRRETEFCALSDTQKSSSNQQEETKHYKQANDLKPLLICFSMIFAWMTHLAPQQAEEK